MKSRFTAFFMHISASLVVALGAIFIVYFIWYPAPLDQAYDIFHIFLLLLAVHLTIGPILTFLVYQPQKKLLALDLSIIVILQLLTLGYGLHTIFQGRPAFIVFAQDRFETVSPIDIDSESQAQALKEGNELARASWLNPVWVATQASKDPKRANEILFSALQGGPDWPNLPELYTPLADLKVRMLEKAKSLPALRILYKEENLDIKNQLTDYKDSDVKWLPLKGKTKNMIVLLDAKSAEIISVLNIDPYLN